ncbi:MAG: hypothetical protein NT074_02265 [Methanomicrobiales archaeon]|nr:hypothetical protein [Methanomicrobiales archaeon]
MPVLPSPLVAPFTVSPHHHVLPISSRFPRFIRTGVILVGRWVVVIPAMGQVRPGSGKGWMQTERLTPRTDCQAERDWGVKFSRYIERLAAPRYIARSVSQSCSGSV